MKRVTRAFSLLLLLSQADVGLAAELPSVTHYSSSYRIFPKEKRLEAEALITVKNTTEEPQSEIPFLLYRLLAVESADDETGAPLRFSQTVVSDADYRHLQVNSVKVQLRHPLPPGASNTISLRYSGYVYGYREVWAYVRESIGEEYTLLRDDSFAYPMLAVPTLQSRHADRRFTYDLEVTVPPGYTVATGGRLRETRTGSEFVTFVYESKVPVWRLDIAAAKFSVRNDETGKLFVYVLPGHEEGADRVLKAMQDVVALYTRLFGSVGNFQGYTAIEIPDGWGSQAADLYFLQTAAAFENPKAVAEVYHEVAHNWNAKAKPDVQRCRYFDEAFASYFESLAQREFLGQKAFEDDMEQSRKIFLRWVESDKLYLDTPIAEYGKHEIGRLSYTKGAWSLYVLHQLVGEDAFRQIVRKLLADFSDRPADFEDFRKIAEQVTKTDLSKFFDEWFYGAQSSRLLLDNVPVSDIVRKYQ